MIKLKQSFLKKYVSINPFDYNNLGKFTYLRSYSRKLPNGDYETWLQTCERVVNYSMSLYGDTKNITKEDILKEGELLFNNMFNFRQFVSGRTTFIGGTPSSITKPMSNYNCAFIKFDDYAKLGELLYVLMLGCGVGVRVLSEDIGKLPIIKKHIRLNTVIPPKRNVTSGGLDNTTVSYDNSRTACYIRIGDSKEGWSDSLNHYLTVMCNPNTIVDSITLDFLNVRSKGKELKTFGGTASGYVPLMEMFNNIHKILTKNINEPLKSIDCLDIVNYIGNNVVVGGVRRTAQMIIMDDTDEECKNAKNDIHTNDNIKHRHLSNNAVLYKHKPSRQEIGDILNTLRYTGEPSFINYNEAVRRYPKFEGLNPCGEILLHDRTLCNLTTVNVYGFATFVENDNDESYFVLDEKGLLQAQRLSARANYRMSKAERELATWSTGDEDDVVYGCSLTGWQDAVNCLRMCRTEQIRLLKKLRKVARQEIEEVSGKPVNVPVTTIKPEGTLSIIAGCSSGLHYRHSKEYIRRVRFNKDDKRMKNLIKKHYVKAFVETDVYNSSNDVIGFVVNDHDYKPHTKYSDDVTAIEQLENYLLFMEHYVDHNASITVTVGADEWIGVGDWLYKNWSYVVAISFLAKGNGVYKQMPLEKIK